VPVVLASVPDLWVSLLTVSLILALQQRESVCQTTYHKFRQPGAKSDGPRVGLGKLLLEKDAEEMPARRTAVC
jgi:hypothetical protein